MEVVIGRSRQPRSEERLTGLSEGLLRVLGCPLGGKLTFCCHFPVGRALTYQKGLSIRRGVCEKKNKKLTIAGVSPQALRETERNSLLQLQSLPLLC